MRNELANLMDHLAAQARRVTELQTELTACRAVGPENGGPGESDKAAAIAVRLATVGITDILRLDAPDPRVPSGVRPNLVARLPGRSKRTLWLFAHMDVVPPGDADAWHGDPWRVRQEGDWLYGRGVEDNQQAIVSMLLLAQALHQCAVTPELSLGLVFMADEECGNTYGLAHVLAMAPHLFHPEDLYIVPDAGRPEGDLVEIAEKTQFWLKITTTGVQCHASTPHKGRNALLAAADMALASHAALNNAFPQRNPLFSPDSSTFVPTRHDANVPGINILPGRDVFWMDCRLLPGVAHEDVLACLRDVARRVESTHGVTVAVETELCNEATAIPEDSPIIAALGKAVMAVRGVSTRVIGIGGGTVAALLRRQGLPAVVWSSVANTCHQPNERSSITATIQDAQVFARLLMAKAAQTAHA